MSGETELNPRNPFVVDAHELGRSPGSQRKLEKKIRLPEPLGTDVLALPKDSVIDADLSLEAVMEGVYVTGQGRAIATGQCVRCLNDVGFRLTVPVNELYVYPGKAQGEDDMQEMHGDLLDLEPALVDAFVSVMPFQPLCKPDCQGLCSQCGVRLEDAEEGHTHQQLDPRFSALQALLKDDAE